MKTIAAAAALLIWSCIPTLAQDAGASLYRALATASGPVLVAGSLYNFGEARRRWLDDPRHASAPCWICGRSDPASEKGSVLLN